MSSHVAASIGVVCLRSHPGHGREASPPPAGVVYHVVARAVVGIDLDLGAHLVEGYVLLHHLLEDLQHLFAALFTVVLEEETLDIVKLAATHLAVSLHHGGYEHHEGGVDVGRCAGVAVGAAMRTIAQLGPFGCVGDALAEKISEDAADGAANGPTETSEKPFGESGHDLGYMLIVKVVSCEF